MCRKARGARNGQSGQAILEYLFLMFFAILLVSGFVYQFNGAVRDYFDSYFSKDGYLSCLIEKGLLPGEENDEGGCSLRKFDINNGKTRPVPPAQFNLSKTGLSNSGGGANGFNAGSSGRAGEGGDGSLVPAGGSGKGASKIAKNDKVSKIGKGGSGGDGGGNAGFTDNSVADNGDSSSTGNSGVRGYVPYDTKTNANPVKKSGPVPATDRDLKTAREIAMEKAKKKAEAAKNNGPTFTIGNIFKYIILILMLFAILFFVGSQMVAISRGNKKR